MEELATKNRPLLPWDNEFSGGVPFHLYRWLADTKSGRMNMLDRSISREQNEETMQMEVVVDTSKGEYLNKLEGEQQVIDMTMMTAIYQISATEGIGLMPAMVKHFGEANYSPAFLEKCKNAPVHIADEKYAVAKPEPVKKAKKKRVSKKKAASKSLVEELKARQDSGSEE